ncbi:hypothetical protein ZIOFF_012844 [Zingiber officinale]|uniref:Cell wall hydroxyproline-rich glycoprotein n=1 Tax=Zingiber officinale TaxID=94328 RepID=A0A8J5HSY2_ZINOF|nr:hypothetical protein ZIOFF_012844 [Zingiber officinale]
MWYLYSDSEFRAFSSASLEISDASSEHDPPHDFVHEDPPSNPRLEKAYVALQAWKHVITEDPTNLTIHWCGPHVCNYTGVFCAAAPDDPDEITVAGIDLNGGQIAGKLPEELGLLADLALLHINSNRFAGGLPDALRKMERLFELDVSNNELEGPFPAVVLDLPALRFLDIRFNRFSGEVPSRVFDLPLDALFLNDNDFSFTFPPNLGNSTVSVLVLANTRIAGCFPTSISAMAGTLTELLLLNASLSSCLPDAIGDLLNLTVLDVGFNALVGHLPASLGQLKKLEQLDVAHNNFSGEVPAAVCELPRLMNFTFSDNYFCGEPEVCSKVQDKDDRENCLPERPKQRPVEECAEFLAKPPPVCDSNGCIKPPSSPPPAKLHE